MPDEAYDLPETSLALVAHIDGSCELLVPTKESNGVSTVPDVWMVLAHIFAVKLRDPVWLATMMFEAQDHVNPPATDERIFH